MSGPQKVFSSFSEFDVLWIKADWCPVVGEWTTKKFSSFNEFNVLLIKADWYQFVVSSRMMGSDLLSLSTIS